MVINESGLYSLILSSHLPQAKAFKRWVTSEVLPQIRKTGGYIPTRDAEGCILPGENKIPGRVVNSRRHLANLIARLTEAYSRGETVWLSIS